MAAALRARQLLAAAHTRETARQESSHDIREESGAFEIGRMTAVVNEFQLRSSQSDFETQWLPPVE